MFGRRNRFDEVGKSNDSPIRVEYLSLSDFIRQQFLKQRNIFDSTTERPKSAVGKVEKHLANQYSTQYENFETKKPRPKTANAAMESTKFYNQDQRQSMNTSLLYREPESSLESPPRPKKKFTTKRATAASQIAVDNQQQGSVLRNGVDINPPTPGPGSYHQPSSLVKPSFNRVFTEPEPALPLSKAATLSHTMAPRYTKRLEDDNQKTDVNQQPINSLNEDVRVEYRPAWDHGSSERPSNSSQRHLTHEEKARMWEKYKGAYFNKAKLRLRSAPPSSQRPTPAATTVGRRSAWADDDDELQEKFPLTFKVKDPNRILNDDESLLEINHQTRSALPKTKIAKQNEILYAKRYPSLSDDQMKRWESVDHTTYVNKSNQKLPIAMRLVAGKVANRTKKNHYA